jgi:MFS transporter, YNFM family, putative membrane transport protein
MFLPRPYLGNAKRKVIDFCWQLPDRRPTLIATKATLFMGKDTKLALPDVASFIQQGTPAFVQTNLALFASGFATFALLYCVQPLLPVLSTAFRVTPTEASLSISLTTALLAVSLPIAGSLSEMWGRKPIMVASVLLSATLGVISSLVPNWPALLVVRAAMGITLSGLPSIAMAYVGEEMHPESMGLAMGLYIGGNALGGMSGRLLTGVISDLWGWRTALLALGILGLGCGLILWRALPVSRHFVASEPRLRAVIQPIRLHLSDPALRWLFAEGFLLMGSFVTLYNYISYRLLAPPFSLSQTAVGLIFAIYVFGLFGSAWIGNLAAKMGRLRFLLSAILVTLIGNFLTLSDRLWLIIAGVAILTFGFFASHSIASSWVTARARQAKAQASSLYLLTYYLGSSIAGSAGGLFWASAGWAGVISLTGALLLAAMAIALNLNGWEPA